MDLLEVSSLVQNALVNSASFPVRKGHLKSNFLDETTQSEDKVSFGVLNKQSVYYGKILQERASINYKTKNSSIRHKNRHFRYIDRIIQQDVIPQIENTYGVRRI